LDLEVLKDRRKFTEDNQMLNEKLEQADQKTAEISENLRAVIVKL